MYCINIVCVSETTSIFNYYFFLMSLSYMFFFISSEFLEVLQLGIGEATANLSDSLYE